MQHLGLLPPGPKWQPACLLKHSLTGRATHLCTYPWRSWSFTSCMPEASHATPLQAQLHQVGYCTVHFSGSSLAGSVAQLSHHITCWLCFVCCTLCAVLVCCDVHSQTKAHLPKFLMLCGKVTITRINMARLYCVESRGNCHFMLQPTVLCHHHGTMEQRHTAVQACLRGISNLCSQSVLSACASF